VGAVRKSNRCGDNYLAPIQHCPRQASEIRYQSGGALWLAPRRENIAVSSIFVVVDDKHIPVYRIMWVADTPHFCGNDDCVCEGDYEVRLEQDESVWASRQERDNVLKAVEAWYNGERDADDADTDWDE
jgi:hypothetical protein